MVSTYGVRGGRASSPASQPSSATTSACDTPSAEYTSHAGARRCGGRGGVGPRIEGGGGGRGGGASRDRACLSWLGGGGEWLSVTRGEEPCPPTGAHGPARPPLALPSPPTGDPYSPGGLKKERMRWSPALHARFVAAVSALGECAGRRVPLAPNIALGLPLCPLAALPPPSPPAHSPAPPPPQAAPSPPRPRPCWRARPARGRAPSRCCA